MNSPTSPDDAWFEALAGRSATDTPGAHPGAALEARMLRHALREWPTPLPLPAQTPSAESESARIAALMAHAHALAPARRRVGWLGTWCGGCAARWQLLRVLLGSRRVWGGLGLASFAAAFTIGLLHEPTALPPTELPVLRSPASGLWMLRDAEPQARRDRIAADLEAGGIVVRRYEFLGRYGLEADVAMPLAPAAAAALQRQGLRVGPDGDVRVEVEEARR